MSRLADIPIRGKILCCLGITLLPIALVMGICLWAINASRIVLADVTDHLVPELLTFTDLREKGLRLIDTLDKLAIAAESLHDNPKKLAEVVSREKSAIDVVVNAFAASHESVASLITQSSDLEKAKIDMELAATVQVLMTAPVRVVSVLSAAPSVNEIIRMRRQFKDQAYRFRALINSEVSYRNNQLADGNKDLTAAIGTTLDIMAGGLLIMLTAYWLSAAYLSRHIVKPMRSLRDAARRMGEGNFDAALQKTCSDEVGELMDSFLAMREQLREATAKLAKQERMAAIGQVAGMVSHELRNPLTTIQNSLDLLRHKSPRIDASIDRVMQRMDRAIERCIVIIDDLLDFFREVELHRAPTMLDSWIGEVLSEYNVPAGVTVEQQLGFGGELLVDPNRLQQVLINLFDNAVQALSDPGNAIASPKRLTIRTEATGPHARISVIDNGPGIAPEMLTKIFEPLFTTRNFGSGLGLPTVRKLVQQHGGTINVESAISIGTTFTIWLPRHERLAPPAVTAVDETRAA